MRQRFLPCLLAIAAMLVPSAAVARGWSESGGWTIGEGDDFCVMTQEFEGPGDSEVFLTMYANGLILLADVNSGWSSTDDQVYDDIAATMDGQAYGGSKAVGVTVQGKHGFAIRLDPSMVNDIATASDLVLYKGTVRMDHLDMKGTAAAIATTRRCLAAVRADQATAAREEARAKAAAERERQRYAGISKDPFAKP